MSIGIFGLGVLVIPAAVVTIVATRMLNDRRRFQFSLIRLFACMTAFCVAAAAIVNGIVVGAREERFALFAAGWLVAWSMLGVAVWVLVKQSATQD